PPPTLPPRQTYGDNYLVGRKRRGQTVEEEILGQNGTWSIQANNVDLGFTRDSNSGKFGSGIGVRQATANRSAIADLVVRHVFDRFHQQWLGLCKRFIPLDVAPAHECTKGDAAIIDINAAELRD